MALTRVRRPAHVANPRIESAALSWRARRRTTLAALHPAGAGRIVIERGEGSYIWDSEGNRYLDALSALYCVNIGYGPWPEIAEAAKRQVEELPLLELGRLRARAGARAREKLTRARRSTSAGSSSSAAAPRRSSRRSRSRASTTAARRADADEVRLTPSAYHGRRSGRSPSTGARRCAQFEPLLPAASARRCRTATAARTAPRSPGARFSAPDEIDGIVQNEGPETVAAVILEPVQNSGGSIVPPEGYFDRVRDLRRTGSCSSPTRSSAASGAATGSGPPATASARLDDAGEGITSAYAPLGAVVASAQAIEPFFAEPQNLFTHGITFGGHPLVRDRAREHRDLRAGGVDRAGAGAGPSCMHAASSSWQTIRWWATCAATATSTRWSS